MFFQISEYITSIIFFFDILYNFNKAYLNSDGRLIISRSKIACKYLKCWFWIDAIASFPFFLISQIGNDSFGQGLKTTKILRIMNIVRLFRLAKLIKEFFPKDLQNRSQKYFVKFKKNNERLVVHIFIVLIICHIFACIFYILPISFSPKVNWVLDRDLQNHTPMEKYLFSMHWMIETIITVGYGENSLKYFYNRLFRFTNYKYNIRKGYCYFCNDYWSNWILFCSE